MTLRIKTAAFALVPLAALGTVALAGATPAGASNKGTTVKAVETDFHIALSKKVFTAGTYTFLVQNKGGTTHSLAITGPGLHNATSADISPGQNTKLTVTFKKGGKYDIYCPIPGHKALGMNVNMTVGKMIVAK
jgi:plastocyanin